MKEIQDLNNEEHDDIQKDIHALWQRIDILEKAIAFLIHEAVRNIIYGHSGSVSLKVENLISDRVKYRKQSQDLIEELGGERKFIDMFLNPSESNPDDK